MKTVRDQIARERPFLTFADRYEVVPILAWVMQGK